MGFVFDEEVVEGFEVVEGGGGAEIEDGGEGVSEDEVVVCPGGVSWGKRGGGGRGPISYRRESFLVS